MRFRMRLARWGFDLTGDAYCDSFGTGPNAIRSDVREVEMCLHVGWLVFVLGMDTAKS